jgi:hypothetical protein
VAATPIGFRADAAQPFDARCLSWQIPEQVGGREATVSIWTTHGRCTNVRVLAAARELVLLGTRSIGETDLVGRDGKWYLYATVEAPQAPLTDPINGFVGVGHGHRQHRHHQRRRHGRRRPAQPLSQTSAQSREAVAGQENIIGAAAA